VLHITIYKNMITHTHVKSSQGFKSTRIFRILKPKSGFARKNRYLFHLGKMKWNSNLNSNIVGSSL